ncbi:MAG TPA: hypothetical protein PKA03_00485 [Tabrizicola sp.]|nr:hypothetical protein [Tabrizicola sp.]
MTASKDTLVIIGTPDTMTARICARARADLGFPIKFEPLDGIELQRRVVLSPESFDVVDHWSTTAEMAWVAEVLQPVDTSRIAAWSDIFGTDGLGFSEFIRRGAGAAPGKNLFVQPSGKMGVQETSKAIMLPTVHNCDSFAWTTSLSGELGADEAESWGWLLDPRFSGLVALSAHASISGLEAALAARANGLMRFDDIGNLSVGEIDQLIDILVDFKRKGHFRGFWHSTPEAQKMLTARGGSVQSIWAHGVQSSATDPESARYAAPAEGYRAWVDGLFLSCCLPEHRTDQAYAFLNWWLSGWPGAQMVREGTFATNPGAMRTHLPPEVWSRLFESSSHDVQPSVYAERFGKVAVWNSFMDEHNYLTRRWSDLLRDGPS